MDKSDYKLPLALMVEEHRAIPPKTNWDLGVKFSFYSVNMSQVAPFHLCHLLIHAAFKLRYSGRMPSTKLLLTAKLEQMQ